MGRVVFVIQKSFGKLCLSDENGSLAIEFIPCLEGQPLDKNHPQYCKVHIDKSALGELLVTAKCFLHGYETGDFTFTKKEGSEDEIVVRLYKDRHKSGDECWLRLVTGKSEDQRKRIRLTKRDLLSVQSAVEMILFD